MGAYACIWFCMDAHGCTWVHVLAVHAGRAVLVASAVRALSALRAARAVPAALAVLAVLCGQCCAMLNDCSLQRYF